MIEYSPRIYIKNVDVYDNPPPPPPLPTNAQNNLNVIGLNVKLDIMF